MGNGTGNLEIKVRYSMLSVRIGFIVMLIVCVAAFRLPHVAFKLVFGPLALFYLYHIVPGILRALDRRPIMLIGQQGVSLPCAENVIIPHEMIDSWWIEEHREEQYRWRTISIQCSPRTPLFASWWAQMGGVATDTLFEGDILFDENRIDTRLERIVSALEHYRQQYPHLAPVSASVS